MNRFKTKEKISLKIGAILAIFCLIFVYSELSGYSRNMVTQNVLPQVATSAKSSDPSDDEWSMFRCRLNHTGITETTPKENVGAFWNNTFSAQVNTSSPSIANGLVYIGSVDQKLYCLNATTGEFVWSYPTGGIVDSSPAVADGYVFVGSNYGDLFCLNATTGHYEWLYYGGGGSVLSSPAVYNGTVFIGLDNGSLACINETNGRFLWSYTTPNSIVSSPAISDGALYIGSNYGDLYCINASKGNEIWKNFAGGPIRSSPAVSNGLVYVGSGDTKFYCFNATNGIEKWHYITGDVVDSSPAIFEEFVYVGSYDGLLYCLNAINGDLVWSYDTGNSIYSSPAISNEKVYVGILDGRLLCLDVYTGDFLWSYDMGAFSYSSPAVSDGMVYIGVWDYKIYCFPMILMPSAPKNPHTTSGNSQLYLGWSVPADNGGSPILGYKIYRGTSPGSEQLEKSLGNVLYYIDTGLTNGQTYYYKISAVNINGESNYSTEFSGTPIGPPSQPLNLQAVGGNYNVVLTWDVPSTDGGTSITSYDIYRGSTSGGESFLDYTDNVQNFTDSLVSNGYTYYYQVRAQNSYGQGAYSTEVVATPHTTPTAPGNLQVTADGTQISLTWDPPSNDGGASITGYHIYRGTSYGSEVLIDTVGNVFNYMDTGLNKGQTYYYQVNAINIAGESPRSDEGYAIIPKTVPTAPQNFQIQNSNKQAVLSWEAPIDTGGALITEYKIYRGTASGNEVYIASVYNTMSYTDTNITDGQTYYYTVSAVNEKGESVKSLEKNITSTTSGNKSIGGIGVGIFFPASLLGIVVVVLSVKKRLK